MPIAQVLLPKGWKRPRGWSHGVLTANGQLQVAGQFGWDPTTQAFASSDFGEQWRQALENVLAIVGEAGGSASNVMSLRIYVLSILAYRSSGPEVASGWAATFASYFPAITMVEVARLTEDDALVEIEAAAQL